MYTLLWLAALVALATNRPRSFVVIALSQVDAADAPMFSSSRVMPIQTSLSAAEPWASVTPSQLAQRVCLAV